MTDKRRYALLRPYSHQLGSTCLIPGTSYLVRAFASKLQILSLEDPSSILQEIPIPTTALLRQFMLVQDLESRAVGCMSEQFRLFITPSLEIQKRPPPLYKAERICLGVYKQQEVEAIAKRLSLTEIFPLLFRLGTLLPLQSTQESRGVFSLLEQCRTCKEPEKIKDRFHALYRAGFTSFLVPQREDLFLQNLYQQEAIQAPLAALLSETAAWIRSLFFTSSEEGFALLPHLPPECVFGKCFDFDTPWGKVDFAWSKKQPFTLCLRAQKSGLLDLHLPSEIKKFRYQRGRKTEQMRSKDKFEVEKGQIILLDRFEK